MPVIWDAQNKVAGAHPEHDINKVDINKAYVEKLLSNGFANATGMAMKLLPPNLMIDFDSKNSDNKNCFQDWMAIISNTDSDVLSKVCIEKTRSGGHHVYFKHAKITHKLALARNNGKEVISIYAGGLLSYCYPTPGYELVHNEFSDIDFISDDQLDLFINSAALLNEDKDFIPGEHTVALVDYPTDVENKCIQFDNKCTDHVFNAILNSIGLFEISADRQRKNFRNAKFTPYLRDGSTGSYSAKAYFKTKRLLIFSGSMTEFPTWHDRTGEGDYRWVLTPSKILFYKNNKSWSDALTEMDAICESSGIELVDHIPVTRQSLQSDTRLKFPYDIFPDWIQDYIYPQTIQHEYMASAMIASLATAIGAGAVLVAMDGYIVRPVVYMAIIAPPGASKTPALKKAFEPIEKHDKMLYVQYLEKHKKYTTELSDYNASKNKNGAEPLKEPDYTQTLIKDSTVEMLVKIMGINKMGCCVFSDELAGFLNRMNQYKSGDEVQKWLELWSSETMLVQRIGRETTRLGNPVCSIVGGIQPGVLEQLSKGDNEHNGFFHRFLMCYPDLQKKADWNEITIPQQIKRQFLDNFNTLIYRRSEVPAQYTLSKQARDIYKQWFDYKNVKYDKARSDDARGIIAKYQNYCLRFALIIQIIHNPEEIGGEIHYVAMEHAIRLTEYYLGNMNKAIRILSPESPVDKMSEFKRELYAALPDNFSHKTFMETARLIGFKDSAAKNFLHRDGRDLFVKRENTYEKLY